MTRNLVVGRLDLLAVLAFAGIVSVAHPAGAAIIIDASNQDVTITDSTGDDSGNTVGSVTFASVTAGEGTADVNETRGWLPFVLTAQQRDQIALAEKIELVVRLNTNENTTGLMLDIYGYNNRTSDVAVAGDYQAAASLVVNDALSSSDATGFYQFDVTSFVKAQAALGANTIIAFRLQVDPASLPNGDSLRNRFVISSADSTTAANRPHLLLTPEPGSLSALSAGVLMLFSRRRSYRDQQ